MPETLHLDLGTARQHHEEVHTTICKLRLCPYMLLAPQTLLSLGAARSLLATQRLEEKQLLSYNTRDFCLAIGLAGKPEEGTFPPRFGGALRRAAAIRLYRG